MAYTDQQIRDYAMALEAKGAPVADIEQFVSSAKSEQGQSAPPSPRPSVSAPMASPEFTMALKRAGSDEQRRAIVAAQGTPSGGGSLAGQIGQELAFGPKMAAKWLMGHRGQAADIAMQGAAPALGQRFAGPAGKYAGAAVGDALSQVRQMGAGERTQFSPGEMGGAAIAAFGGKSMAGPRPASMAHEALTGGAANMAGQAAGVAFDECRPLTAQQARTAFAGGALSAPISAALDTGAVAAKGMARKGNASEKMTTYERALDEGLVLDSSISNRTVANRIAAEGTGTTAIRDEFSRLNQEGANRIVRRELDLPEGTSLNKHNYLLKRSEEAAPYREFAALTPTAGNILKKWSEARHDAKKAWRDYGKSGDIRARETAEGFDKKADAIENFMIVGAKRLGRRDLVDRIQTAKVNIAKIHAADSATNPATGDIYSSVFGAMVENKVPLTGGLATIGRLQLAMPSVMREIHTLNTGTAPLSQLARSAVGTGAVGSRLNQQLLRSPIPSYGETTPDFAASMARFATQAASREPTEPVPYFLRKPQ